MKTNKGRANKKARKRRLPPCFYTFIGMALAIVMVLAVQKVNNRPPAEAYIYTGEMTEEERIEEERRIYNEENGIYPSAYMQISEMEERGYNEGDIITIEGTMYIVRTVRQLREDAIIIKDTSIEEAEVYTYIPTNN